MRGKVYQKNCIVCLDKFKKRPTEAIKDFKDRQTCGNIACVRELQRRSRQERIKTCIKCGKDFVPLESTKDQERCHVCRRKVATNNSSKQREYLDRVQRQIDDYCRGPGFHSPARYLTRPEIDELVERGAITHISLIPRDRHIECRVLY